jgi:DNA-binding CsgD family transcriptional regulator
MLKSGRHDDVFYAAMTAALDSKSYWHGDIWDKRKNGEIFPARMLISTVKDTAGKTSHYVGSFLDITEQKQAEKVLSDDRKRLEKQVEKSVTELGQIKEESSEVNTALKVMIKLRETENSDAKNLLILELKQEVMPFLQRLKNSSRDPKHIRLLNILDANLQRLISSYGSATSLTSAYKNLTPKEIQVASMVREGASTKVIASTLSLSPETISIHRKNIRKKLSLGSKADNLRSYLLTFDK